MFLTGCLIYCYLILNVKFYMIAPLVQEDLYHPALMTNLTNISVKEAEILPNTNSKGYNFKKAIFLHCIMQYYKWIGHFCLISIILT